MRLAYWVCCRRNDDDFACNIRARTKREAKAKQEEIEEKAGYALYESPRRVEIDYKDGFDLLTRCLTGELMEKSRKSKISSQQHDDLEEEDAENIDDETEA